MVQTIGSQLNPPGCLRDAAPSPSRIWSIYDALLDPIEPGLRVASVLAGCHWFTVEAADGMGLAMSPREFGGTVTGAGGLAGGSLREIAGRAKSWNFSDAAAGVAAINAFHNHPLRVKALNENSSLAVHENGNAFQFMRPRLQGKRVAVIGHFRSLEELAAECELTILERKPQPGDLPDPACEVVLPKSDFVFITATTLINKTLPRLLELSARAHVTLVGPTTPLTAKWFEMGVDLIGGLVVDDPIRVGRIVSEGGQHQFFESGAHTVQIERRNNHGGNRTCG